MVSAECINTDDGGDHSAACGLSPLSRVSGVQTNKLSPPPALILSLRDEAKGLHVPMVHEA